MNKNTIFIDTGAWFAVADKSDQFHHHATSYLNKVVEKATTLVTSNLVIHETVMLLTRKLSKITAIQFLDKTYGDDSIVILQSNEDVEQKAFELFKKYSDHGFSVVDCVSFILMKEQHLKNVFTFDKHFKVMKFSINP